MRKIIIPIKGMHCKSCELLIEENVSKIPNVHKADAIYKKSILEVYHYNHLNPDMNQIEESVRSAGYDIGQDEKKGLISKNPSDYKDLGIAFLFLVGLYFILKNFGILSSNFGFSSANPSSLSVVFLVGLTAGISTCMALVGGLVLGVSARHSEKHPEATPLQKFRPHLFFNMGRILLFTLFGGILGSLGSVFQFSSLTLGIITIVVGAVMLIVGFQLTEIFPFLNRIKITLPKFISKKVGANRHEKEYSHKSSMLLGGMTFFLPCGFTQAMQLYAISTGSFLTGALVMGTFALGTAPGLLGIGGLTAVVKGIFARRFFKFAGILVIFFSLFNISNGYNLTGWQIGSQSAVNNSQSTSGQDPNVTLQNGVQIVKMTQSAQGYSPKTFTIKKGIPVKWTIDAQEPYSCSSTITISKLNITKRLTKGENVIEFTPTEIGALKFSCSMGMYTGVFNVVDDQGNGATSSELNNATKSSGGCGGSTASGGGCGGGGSAGGGCGGCGGGKPVVPNAGKTEQINPAPSTNSPSASSDASEQVLKTSYTLNNDIQPNTFTVKAGVPVRLLVDVKEDGQGCMSTIMVPGLYNTPEYLQKGKTIAMAFTPAKKGDYQITCAMGVPRGVIKVN
ncbi:MAG: sulfite exporter TauE/SafE family protein [Patescibacteria group bacterium]